MSPIKSEQFRKGVALFNAANFFDAHEALEDVWRESRGDERDFLQGLIQIAVGLHHHSTGNVVGALSLLSRGGSKLARFPDEHDQLRIDLLRTEVARWCQALEQGRGVPPPPRLNLAGGDVKLPANVARSATKKKSSRRNGITAVPLLDLHRQYAKIRSEVLAAVERVCASQQFVLGAEVEVFEREAAAFLGCAYAVGCSSGTDALWLALSAAGVRADDSVITTPFSFFASASSIVRAGARPVFVDVDAATLNLSPAAVEQKVRSSPESRLAAILPVHLYGQCADMDYFERIAREHGLALIEDAAQAFAARWGDRRAGSMGDAAALSFYPSKNLSAYGDAGCVTTNDGALSDRVRRLRNHGSHQRYYHDEIGWCNRLDSIQAAVLRVKLKYVADWTEQRRQRAAAYDRLFREAGLASKSHTSAPVRIPCASPQAYHVFHQYVVCAERRDHLRQFLSAREIGTEVYYPVPLHLQKAFAYLGYSEGDLPEAERAATEVLALPMFPELTEDEQRVVVQGIAEFYS